jgi:hypothetical protein
VLRRWQCGDGDGLMLPVARSDRGVRSVALAASRLYVGDGVERTGWRRGRTKADCALGREPSLLEVTFNSLTTGPPLGLHACQIECQSPADNNINYTAIVFTQRCRS